MRSFEFALTLAGGFAPPAPAGEAVRGEAELLKRAPHPGQRDAQADLFEPDLGECQAANLRRLAAVKSGS